jgi:polar amino acid transport system substrate-binding protein
MDRRVSLRCFLGVVAAALFAACSSLANSPPLEIQQALAPTGKLRVGLIDGAPANVVRDRASGDMKGVGYELGRELARRIGVRFEPVLYPSVGALLEAGRSAEWDVTFNGITPDREKYLDFTAPHLEIDFGYLVPAGSQLLRFEDVDQAGVRVAVPARGAADVLLSRTLKAAVLVRGAGLPGTLELVKSGKADVFAANKPNLFEMMRGLPGSRMLEGRPGSETQAMLIPKGRDVALPYARSFIEAAKAEGRVQAAIDRAELRGAVVAPRGEALEQRPVKEN